jgi:hypothetical protein
MSTSNNQGNIAPLAHQVYFWLHNPADLDRLLEGVHSLTRIETIKGFHIGVPAATEERGVIDNSYAVSWLAFFDNEADEHRYQTHPIHLEFIAQCESLWSKVVVYDAVNS